jgi:signal peptidase I
VRVTSNRALRVLCGTTDLLLLVTVTLSLALFAGRLTDGEHPGLPTWFGRSVLAVTSGSMAPTLRTGDAVVADLTVDTAEITPGDVIVYVSAVRPDMMITHRVTAVDADGDGDRVFTTSGDATSMVDTAMVSEHQVVGRMTARLPFAGVALAATTDAVVPIAFTAAALLAHLALQTSRSTTDHINGTRRRPGAPLHQKDHDT